MIVEKTAKHGENPMKELHGWDDEKVYFWDEENKKDWCVSDDEELYNQVVEMCRRYFKEKNSKKKI